MGIRAILSLVLVSACLLMAWWWPGLMGRGERSDVTVIGTGEISRAREVVSRRIREAGLSVAWEDSVTNWCEASAFLNSVSTPIVVLAPSDLGPCTADGSVVDAASLPSRVARRMVLVALEPSATVAELEDNGARRVATERLIGAVGEQMSCVWWEDCPSSGTVVTRAEDGLTEAGRQRLARLITARLS